MSDLRVEVRQWLAYSADDLPPVDIELAREYEKACREIHSWAHQVFQSS